VEKLSASTRLLEAGMANIKGGAIMAGVGAAIAAPVLATVPAAARFEHRMAEVSTMIQDTTTDLRALSAGVLRLSSDFGQVPDTMGHALYNVLSAGIPASGALEVLRLSAQAATAGVTDVNTAATLGANILNAYQLPVTELGRVYDVLFKTVQQGVTTFPELGAYMGEVTSIAAAARIPVEQVGAALAVMTKAGIKTPEAATSLRGLIQAIAAPTSMTEKALQEMGGAELQAAVAAGDLVTAVRILGRSATTLASIREVVPDVRAAKGFAALANNMQLFLNTAEEMKGAGGAMGEAFAKMKESAMFKYDQLKSSLAEIAITIGNELLPAVTDLLGQVKPVLRYVVDLMHAHPKWTSGIVKGTVALGALILSLGLGRMALGAFQFALGGGLKLMTDLTGASGMLGRMLTWMNPARIWKDVPVTLAAVRTALNAAAAASWRFTASVLANPITWILAAVVGTVAAIAFHVYVMVRRWDEARAIIGRMSIWLKGALMIMSPMLMVTITLATWWDKIRVAVAKLPELLGKMASFVAKGFFALGRLAVDVIDKVILKITGIKGAVSKVAEFVAKLSIGLIVSVINFGIGQINGFLRLVNTGLKALGKEPIQLIKEVSPEQVVGGIRSAADYVKNTVQGDVAALLDFGKLYVDEGKGLYDGLGDSISAAFRTGMAEAAASTEQLANQAQAAMDKVNRKADETRGKTKHWAIDEARLALLARFEDWAPGAKAPAYGPERIQATGQAQAGATGARPTAMVNLVPPAPVVNVPTAPIQVVTQAVAREPVNLAPPAPVVNPPPAVVSLVPPAPTMQSPAAPAQMVTRMVRGEPRPTPREKPPVVNVSAAPIQMVTQAVKREPVAMAEVPAARPPSIDVAARAVPRETGPAVVRTGRRETAGTEWREAAVLRPENAEMVTASRELVRAINRLAEIMVRVGGSVTTGTQRSRLTREAGREESEFGRELARELSRNVAMF